MFVICDTDVVILDWENVHVQDICVYKQRGEGY